MIIESINPYKPLVILTPDGDVIHIKITKVGKRQVQLGIESKKKAGILRKEVWERIRRENKLK